MSILEVVILAIMQGIAEFLPISSSAHLIIFRDIFGIGSGISSEMELIFDIALHLGTLLAIGLFFFKDFMTMITKGFTKGFKDSEGKMLWYIILATIPAAVVGLLFEEVIENVIRNSYVVIAIALAFVGFLIYYIDKVSKSEKDTKSMTLVDALIVGCCQVFALIPGFSRSGTTIATARLLKIDRTSAAKFSFYLSAPVVAGAVVLQLFDSNTIEIIMNNLSTFIVGILVAFLSGLVCIKFLLKYLEKHNFKVFMIYRFILAIIILLSIFL